MSLPPRFLDEIKERVSLSDIIGRRVKIVRAGREFKACCPFHGEKTPSFTINDQKGFYHCFGCGVHGDAISFLTQHDNLEFMEAVEMLAHEAGMEVPKPTPQEAQKFERSKSLYELVEATAQFFHEALYQPMGQGALAYLRGRGLADDAIQHFKLGYAPQDSSLLFQHLRKQNFKPADMIEAGVFRESNRGGNPYSFFRDRVMFPVADRKGRIVAFGGRLMQGEGPKYINTSDTPLFHKGRLLYNMAGARMAGGKGNKIIVCEGYMDVIALVRAGFSGAVAPNGTALTEDQIAEIWKLCAYEDRNPVLCFDGDKAGRRAAIRAMERILPLLKPDQSAKVAFLPDGEDPDSLLQNEGVGRMKEVVETARPLVDILWESVLEGRAINTPEARAGVEYEVMQKVDTITDPMVQNFYRQDMKDRLWKQFSNRKKGGGFKAGGGRKQWKSGPAKGSRFYNPLTAPTPEGLNRRRPQGAHVIREKLLLASMVNHIELMECFEEDLSQITMQEAPLETLRNQLFEAWGAVLEREDLHPEEGFEAQIFADSVTDLLKEDEDDVDQEAAEKQAGLKAARRQVVLENLSQAGLEPLLTSLLCDPTYMHGRFARPGTKLPQVREALEEFFQLLRQDGVQSDLRKTASTLARQFEDVDNARLVALHHLSDEEGGDLDEEPEEL